MLVMQIFWNGYVSTFQWSIFYTDKVFLNNEFSAFFVLICNLFSNLYQASMNQNVVFPIRGFHCGTETSTE